MRTVGWFIGVLAAVALCWPLGAAAFECPRPEKTSPGVLKETTQDEQTLSKTFAGGEFENSLGVAVSDLQSKYPKVTDTELVNYLVGVYCPVVAQQPGLSDAQKTGKVEQFAASLYALLAKQKL